MKFAFFKRNPANVVAYFAAISKNTDGISYSWKVFKKSPKILNLKNNLNKN
jgi:hypothetical protein